MSEDIQRQKEKIVSAYQDLQRRVNMTDIQSTLTDTATSIAALPERIQGIRNRGYAFANYLEGKAETLAKQWDEVKAAAQQTITQKTRELNADLQGIDDSYTKLAAVEGMAAAIHIQNLEPEIERIKAAVDAAEESVRSKFGEVPNNVEQTIRQLSTIEGYLELTESATFPLLAGESVFMAVKAEWRDERDNPDGIFYVTDQRVVMEQKEKVGKTLGLFGGEEKHEVLWESPIGSISEVSHENKGLLGGVDLIHLKFGSGGPFGNTTVEVKGGIQAEWFAAQLKRASTGGLERERGLEMDEALVEAIVNAPTLCPVCGASFTQPIVAGMNQIKCEYCGSITRLAV